MERVRRVRVVSPWRHWLVFRFAAEAAMADVSESPSVNFERRRKMFRVSEK